MKFLVLLTLILSQVQAPPVRPETWAKPVTSEHLDNFFQVDDGVFRSAQPDRDGMKELADSGFRTILNLRDFHDDEDEAKGLDLVLERVEMSAGDIRTDQVVAALRVLMTGKRPILVHCWHGSDRTGVVCAMYRVVVQGWTREAAITELEGGGYGFHEAVYENIPEYIRTVDVAPIRTQLGLDP